MTFAQPGRTSLFLGYAGFSSSERLVGDFVFVDVETSGFSPAKGARVLEISAIRTTAAGETIEEFSTLINPETSEVGATHVHQILPEMLTDAPTFAQTIPTLNRLFSNAIFVAHNALFDETFIAAEYARAKVELATMPGVDSFWLGRQALPSLPNHKLATLIGHFNIENPAAHSALADSQVLASLMPRLLERTPELTYPIGFAQQSDLGSEVVAKSR